MAALRQTEEDPRVLPLSQLCANVLAAMPPALSCDGADGHALLTDYRAGDPNSPEPCPLIVASIPAAAGKRLQVMDCGEPNASPGACRLMLPCLADGGTNLVRMKAAASRLTLAAPRQRSRWHCARASAGDACSS